MVIRVRLALVLMLLAGCAKQDREREARELATLDLAEASARLRGWIDSCAGFSRALDRLSRISGRSLAGLVDDAVDVATSKCAQPIDAGVDRGRAKLVGGEDGGGRHWSAVLGRQQRNIAPLGLDPGG